MTEIVTLPHRAVRPRFTWILPAIFAAGAAFGTLWPGRGNHLFCIGVLAGIWACYLLDAAGGVDAWLLPALLGGVPILLLLGRLLDRLEVDLRLWTAAFAIFTTGAIYLLLQGFQELGHAIDHHGSFLAFLICALQLGSYGATLALLAISAGRTGRG
jgi:hypothetical protein